jgi:hypothetical protein
VDRSRHHARGPRQGLVPASELLESRAGVAIDRRHICTAYIQSHLQIRNLMYLVAHSVDLTGRRCNIETSIRRVMQACRRSGTVSFRRARPKAFR